MVHDRQQVHHADGEQFLGGRDRVVVGDLDPEVQPVVDVRFGERPQFAGERLGGAPLAQPDLVAGEAERRVRRGDTGSGEPAVQGPHGDRERQAYPRTRFGQLLDGVAVQVDGAGRDDDVGSEVGVAEPDSTVDGGDAAAVHHHGAGAQHPVR